MTSGSRIEHLAQRILRFLKTNEAVPVTGLKHHLDCRTSELLIALGTLLPSAKVELTEDGWETIVRRKEDDVKKEK